jgi:transposase
MKETKRDDGWRISDERWLRMEPILPPPKPHPLDCRRPRVPKRAAMGAILLVLRTGMQWNALDSTGICSGSAAYGRFRAWVEAGVFAICWRLGLLEDGELECIDWDWRAFGSAMTKAPSGGKKIGRNPTGRGQAGVKRSLLTEAGGINTGQHHVRQTDIGSTYLAMRHFACGLITWRSALSK